MVSGAPAAQHIELTANDLQDALDRLEVQRQSLERELAAVVAHHDTVQKALEVIQNLTGTPLTAKPASTEAVAAESTSREPSPRATSTRQETSATSAVRNPEVAKEDEAPVPDTHRAVPEGEYGKLTENIMAYFAEAGDTDVRARDVAAALGRDKDAGSINAVRSTLDRLVATSRVKRSGRGLYRAKAA
ncbi:hypothetical protein [Streptomyces sp. ADI93-02]|uniref:hypothetical protein n=1 Tax=Streptomyces sp. ADI93-02 TaxID=1522757 RepID=UPI000F54DFFF|nr:hypothetical protein [Streptomyces sp. ADI93-02]